jgi:HEAT repeat protein
MLLESLGNSSPVIRANAARALGRLKSRAAVSPLIELLQDSAPDVRARAAEALGAIGDRVSIEPLVQMIKDHAAKVQEAAGAALVKFGKTSTLPLLNALALERDKFALKAFLLLLGKIGDPKAVPALIAHLRSSYHIVRQAALNALTRYGGAIVNLLVPLLSFNRTDIEALKKDAAEHTHPEPQMRAIKALGGLEDHRAVGLLKKLVEEGLPDVQEAATSSLGQIGCGAWGRCCALKVLAEVGKADLVPAIIPSLEDDSDNVRYEAVRTIGRLGGPEALAPIRFHPGRGLPRPADDRRRPAGRARSGHQSPGRPGPRRAGPGCGDPGHLPRQAMPAAPAQGHGRRPLERPGERRERPAQFRGRRRPPPPGRAREPALDDPLPGGPAAGRARRSGGRPGFEKGHRSPRRK